VDRAGTAVRSLTDARATIEVGRRARLELVFGVRRGRTELLHAYAEPPFRVGRALPDRDGVHMILASTGPGIFGGDELVSSVIVEDGARVRLTSQSSLQLHPSASAAVAAIESRYVIESNAHLDCEWDPLIPFPVSRLRQRIRIELAAQSTLYWSDALMAGRRARGERWQCALVDHEVALVREDTLAYLERYRIEPSRSKADAVWQGGAANYFGTVLAVSPSLTGADAERVDGSLQQVSGVTAAADFLEDAVLLARLMSDGGPAFHSARKRCRRLLAFGPATVA
jgi:urease accessory protein